VVAVVLERFAEDARAVVADTMASAQADGVEEVQAEHLLLALTRIPGGPTVAALAEHGIDEALVSRLVRGTGPLLDDDDRDALGAFGIDVDDVVSRIEEGLGPEALAPVPGGARRTRFGREAKKALELAVRTTVARHARSISTDDLLVGVMRVGSPGVERVLTAAGTSASAVIASVGRPAA
jgi:ATP-dependent Clp protease ATP-binding subunit ClpA